MVGTAWRGTRPTRLALMLAARRALYVQPGTPPTCAASPVLGWQAWTRAGRARAACAS